MSERQRDQLLGHAHDNDGIDEFDNPLPAWWLGLLYVTIAFAAVYTLEYHFITKRSQAAEYDAEVAAAPKAKAPEIATIAATPEAIEAGKQVYMTSCVGCHGADLHGGVGPDLTDATWIHGGTLEAITKTITNGVPDKGMLTWGPILGPEKVAQVAVYVHGAGGGQ